MTHHRAPTFRRLLATHNDILLYAPHHPSRTDVTPSQTCTSYNSSHPSLPKTHSFNETITNSIESRSQHLMSIETLRDIIQSLQHAQNTKAVFVIPALPGTLCRSHKYIFRRATPFRRAVGVFNAMHLENCSSTLSSIWMPTVHNGVSARSVNAILTMRLKMCWYIQIYRGHN